MLGTSRAEGLGNLKQMSVEDCFSSPKTCPGVNRDTVKVC